MAPEQCPLLSGLALASAGGFLLGVLDILGSLCAPAVTAPASSTVPADVFDVVCGRAPAREMWGWGRLLLAQGLRPASCLAHVLTLPSLVPRQMLSKCDFKPETGGG